MTERGESYPDFGCGAETVWQISAVTAGVTTRKELQSEAPRLGLLRRYL